MRRPSISSSRGHQILGQPEPVTGEFQVIVLLGVGHGAAGKKRPPDKSPQAALIFQVRPVDAQMQFLARVAKGLQQLPALVFPRDPEGIASFPLAVHGNLHFHHHPGNLGGPLGPCAGLPGRSL